MTKVFSLVAQLLKLLVSLYGIYSFGSKVKKVFFDLNVGLVKDVPWERAFVNRKCKFENSALVYSNTKSVDFNFLNYATLSTFENIY